ncbi:hypothetical protein ACJEDT_12920 [Rhodococcoides fascians]|uniref:hypothetical protein n=1 Tax=Rhodococcoides fascians TaxID=1828 RepID=UPI00389A357D
MTNADGSHYTLKQLQEKQTEFEAVRATDIGRVFRTAPSDADPWAEPLPGGVQINLETLAAAIADLSKMTHELFDRVEPCLADPGDRPDDGGEKPNRVADSASSLRKGLLSLEETVRALRDDVVYVLRRVEL